MNNFDENSTDEIYGALCQLSRDFVSVYKNFYPREENKAIILNKNILLERVKKANSLDDNNNYIYANIEKFIIIEKPNKLFIKYMIPEHKHELLKEFQAYLTTELKISPNQLRKLIEQKHNNQI